MNNRLLLALSLTLFACFSVREARAEYAADARIEKAEQLLLGKTAPEQSIEERLDAVELNLYGRTKHGNVSKRLDAISDFLGIKSDGASRSAGRDEKNASGDQKSVAKGESGSQSKPDSDGLTKASTASDVSTSSGGSAASVTKTDADVKGISDAAGTDFKTSSDFNAGSGVKDPADLNAGSTAQAGSNLKVGPGIKVGSDLKVGSGARTTSGSKKNPPVTLKSEAAKMAITSPSTASATKSSTLTPAKRQDSMPPQAPSIASTMARTGTARDLLREGMKQFSNGQYDDAEYTFRRVLTVDPRNADAFYNLGSLAERRHDYVVALTNYRAALNFNAKDKDYIAAVTAMEHQLSASAAPPPSQGAASHTTKTATLGHFKVPVDAATATPSYDAAGRPINGGADGQPFQLSGTKNDVMMTTTQYTNNYAPTMSVNQGFNPLMSVNQGGAPFMTVNQPGPPPTMGVSQQPPKNGGGFGKVLNVGMRAALYSSGLHCPICRMMGGGFHF
ncbi:MAG TPA: hypothetical protein V6C89_05025 [Drouetiella sp.]|jgi:hypothetical protein